MPYMLSICFLYASYMLPIYFLYASKWYVRNYVSNLNFWQNIWSCCAGTSVTRLKPGCVAEPVADAMAGALLPKNNAKNDGDWVPKRSSFICVCVAKKTGKWFFSSMTLQPFGPLVRITQRRKTLGYLYLCILYTFQSTSTLFQFWSERVREAFLRENRGSSVISIQLHSSPDSQREFDMAEGPS